MSLHFQIYLKKNYKIILKQLFYLRQEFLNKLTQDLVEMAASKQSLKAATTVLEVKEKYLENYMGKYYHHHYLLLSLTAYIPLSISRPLSIYLSIYLSIPLSVSLPLIYPLSLLLTYPFISSD